MYFWLQVPAAAEHHKDPRRRYVTANLNVMLTDEFPKQHHHRHSIIQSCDLLNLPLSGAGIHHEHSLRHRVSVSRQRLPRGSSPKLAVDPAR